MKKEFECNIRIRVKGRNSVISNYCGRGVADLLHGVDLYHSLNISAMNMKMAYSKAWRIIHQAEGVLGMQLLNRMGKKGSELTEEGRYFLKVYEEAEREAVKAIYEVFERNYQEDEEGREPI